MMNDTEIVDGAIYIYTSKIPAGCEGFRYCVRSSNVKHVPSYSKVVLVEAMDGPDKGLLFVCSPNNFAMRYRKEEPPVEGSGI